MTPYLKFYYNGIKAGAKGKLQPARYAINTVVGKYPAGTVHINAKSYVPFSADVDLVFKISNKSEPMTDYFEKDCIHVPTDHPLYNQVLAAALKAEAISKGKEDKFSERLSARRAFAVMNKGMK